jgi:hypothetical protein
MKAAFTGARGATSVIQTIPIAAIWFQSAECGAFPPSSALAPLRFPRSPTGMFEQSFRKMVKPSQPPEWVLFCCKRERLGFIDAAPHGLTQLRQ